jgi:type I restriction enzyme M protein
LKNIEIDETTGKNKALVRAVFEDNNNYMKDGVLLRQVVNVINEIQFEDYEERHVFGEIYETILRSLQSAGNAGEFYTPRAVTDFVARMIAPVLGEKIADFACGTGGFFISALTILEPQVKTTAQRKQYVNSVYGIEKKALPYLLCVTNLLLHDIDSPDVLHGNSLEKNVREYAEKEKFNIILMNPPYGGSEKDTIKINFPLELRSSETADLFFR